MTSTTNTDFLISGKQTNEELYERNLWFVALVPFLWILAVLIYLGFDPNSLIARVPEVNAVKKNAREARGLELIYKYKPKELPRFSFTNYKKWIKAVVREWYFQFPVCQAARNRQKIVHETIRQEGQKIINKLNGRQFRMVSIGCGLAEPVLQAVAFWHKQGVDVRLVLIDVKQEVLDSAMKKARDLNIGFLVQTKVGRAENLERLIGDFHPHLIEMVGVFEYLPWKKALKILTSIQRLLEEGGVFFTANISHWSLERPYVTAAFKWSMIYRAKWQLRKLLERVTWFETRVWSEPWKIFNMAVCQKKKL